MIGYRFACYDHDAPVQMLHLETESGMYCPICKKQLTYRELDKIGELGSERAPRGAVSLVSNEAGTLDVADAE